MRRITLDPPSASERRDTPRGGAAGSNPVMSRERGRRARRGSVCGDVRGGGVAAGEGGGGGGRGGRGAGGRGRDEAGAQGGGRRREVPLGHAGLEAARSGERELGANIDFLPRFSL